MHYMQVFFAKIGLINPFYNYLIISILSSDNRHYEKVAATI